VAASGAEITAETAQLLAVEGLKFIVNDQEVLGRFLSLTGLAPQEVRIAAEEPEFFAGVLAFLMDHEAVLLAFAATAGISPHRVASAHLALSGEPIWDS
jgi:hypothetical protein